jgi:hypothetical protein
MDDVKNSCSYIERWSTEVERAALAKHFQVTLEKHGTKFCRKNRSRFETANELARLNPFHWHEYVKPESYRGYLDVTPILERKRVERTFDGHFDLRGIRFPNGTRGGMFRFIDFSCAAFILQSYSVFYNCVFRDCKIDDLGLYYEHSELMNTCADGLCGYTILKDCMITNLRCERCLAMCFYFENCVVKNSSFRKSGLAHSHFVESTFENCSFRHAAIYHGTYSNTRFIKCDFKFTAEDFIPPGVE